MKIEQAVEQVMSRPVVTCHAGDALVVAAGLMWDNDCGALPVVDEQGRVVGMITDRDICMAAYTSGRPLHSISVRDSMSKTVRSCAPGDDIVEVERVMAHAQVCRLPVLDSEGHVIGIVSVHDIARNSANGSRKTAAEALSTLAAICEPRHRSMVKAMA